MLEAAARTMEAATHRAEELARREVLPFVARAGAGAGAGAAAAVIAGVLVAAGIAVVPPLVPPG